MRSVCTRVADGDRLRRFKRRVFIFYNSRHASRRSGDTRRSVSGLYGYESAKGDGQDVRLRAHANAPNTDFLEVHFDANVVGSYPGSGTTLTDLSGEAHHATLNNGVGFDSTYVRSRSMGRTKTSTRRRSESVVISCTRRRFGSNPGEPECALGDRLVRVLLHR